MKHTYMAEYGNVILKPLAKNDTLLIREWRNNPENCKYLRRIPYITEEMQEKWFEASLEKPEEYLFSIYENEELNSCVGSLGLYDFEDNECYFGMLLIGDPRAHGRGIGVNATLAALKIAFEQLNQKKVYLHVFKENIPAIKVYTKAGFEVLDEHSTKDGKMEYTMFVSKGAEIENAQHE